MKIAALSALAEERRHTRLADYDCIGDFHDGLFECDHVSPWTRSGCNVDADIMIIGQDWASSDMLSANPPDPDILELGYKPRLPTNVNLDRLLARHFGLTRADCYLTNLFPFIKPGNASSPIKGTDLVECAKRFTLEEIRIVSPRKAICLGLQTFTALNRATGRKAPRNLNEAIGSPFRFASAMLHCVAHTGALGMNTRGRDQVDRDWQDLASTRN